MTLSSEFALLLAIVSSASMAVVLKIFQTGDGNRYTILLGNYITCVLIGFFLLPDKNILFHAEKTTMLCGSIGGILFVAGLVGMQSSIRVNGAILTSAFARLGLLVPLAVSILCFRERPGVLQVIGLILVFAAILLINDRQKAGGTRPFLLIAVLIACGSGDAMAKIFERIGNYEQDTLYILFVFLSAALLTALLLIRESRVNGKKIIPGDLLAGILVGIPNYFSSALLLAALHGLPAFIVYPCFSTGALLLVTAVSTFLFREHPSDRQKISLVIILAALIFLNI